MKAHRIVDILLEDEDFDMEGYALAALTPTEAYHLARKRRSLRPKLEPVIAQDAETSVYYAQFVIGKPFPAGEPAIVRNRLCAARYNNVFGTTL